MDELSTSVFFFFFIKLKFIDFVVGSSFLIVNSQVDDSSLHQACWLWFQDEINF